MNPSDLRREEAPPPHVEARIIDELVRRGLIKPPQRKKYAWLAYAAAAIVLFFAGYASHALTQPKPRAFTHVLFLEGGDGVNRVDEYRQWARDLRAQGVHIDGMKLGDAGTVRGFFTITAANRAEAERIARSCPHARYGGRVEVREIEKT